MVPSYVMTVRLLSRRAEFVRNNSLIPSASVHMNNNPSANDNGQLANTQPDSSCAKNPHNVIIRTPTIEPNAAQTTTTSTPSKLIVAAANPTHQASQDTAPTTKQSYVDDMQQSCLVGLVAGKPTRDTSCSSQPRIVMNECQPMEFIDDVCVKLGDRKPPININIIEARSDSSPSNSVEAPKVSIRPIPREPRVLPSGCCCYRCCRRCCIECCRYADADRRSHGKISNSVTMVVDGRYEPSAKSPGEDRTSYSGDSSMNKR